MTGSESVYFEDYVEGSINQRKDLTTLFSRRTVSAGESQGQCRQVQGVSTKDSPLENHCDISAFFALQFFVGNKIFVKSCSTIRKMNYMWYLSPHPTGFGTLAKADKCFTPSIR
jgi:hypothetical protein